MEDNKRNVYFQVDKLAPRRRFEESRMYREAFNYLLQRHEISKVTYEDYGQKDRLKLQRKYDHGLY